MLQYTSQDALEDLKRLIELGDLTATVETKGMIEAVVLSSVRYQHGLLRIAEAIEAHTQLLRDEAKEFEQAVLKDSAPAPRCDKLIRPGDGPWRCTLAQEHQGGCQSVSGV